ncbi:MAG: carbonic anhydrase [Castellaniella sp.]|uniref:carbonic anhydrase n=1 Tax=Castellaniella sp. TaxID=1955812 RepID=UPI0011FBC5D6|nr:carbonic anhydrase [Castellaniella sp.]TAN30590.1 MAG: carbonic anhydrase [Castellaniella sp.]
MCDSKLCTHAQPVTRRRFLQSSAAFALAATASAGLGAMASVPVHAAGLPKPENAVSPDEAIQRLKEGNQRYVSGVMKRHDFSHERKALAGGQNPYAAILGCADSRVAPEYTFDSGRGDLFVTRVAGNFINADMLGSLEYAVAVLSVPAILVLGHEKCGAIAAAVKAITNHAQYPGHIETLVAALTPSVKQVSQQKTDLLEAAIEQNIRNNVTALSAQSDIIRKAHQAGSLRIVGGIYRLATGKVDFLA